MNNRLNKIPQFKIARLRLLIKKLTDFDFAMLYVLCERELIKRQIDHEIDQMRNDLPTYD